MFSIRIQTLALALAFALAGCTAPADEQPSDVNASDLSAADGPQIEYAGPAVGVVRTVQGAVVADARVCLVGAFRCATSQDDGGFSLPDLEDGVAELLRIDADGFTPVIIPMEGGRYDYLDLDIQLTTKRGTPDEGRGSLQIITERVTADGPVFDLMPSWRIQSDRRQVIGVQGARPFVKNLKPGDYKASYELESGLCVELSGWAGANGRSIEFPIEAGAITQIQQLCVR
ncbi:MAG: carboxypeptidase regulatory-like domain-containing protein [Deltaproteobacteria bacterium]|nr:carboxypeptidase regulatory-like domain-containing protein [Deltaproteobacteria bacterium]